MSLLSLSVASVAFVTPTRLVADTKARTSACAASITPTRLADNHAWTAARCARGATRLAVGGAAAHGSERAPPRSRMPLLQAPPPPTPTPDEQQAKLTKLLVSVLIDLIGMATYAVPAIGEVGDLAWAPISAYLVYQLYGNGLIAGLALAEELLPGLDIIPTATIAWLLENTELGQNLNGKAPPASGGSSAGTGAAQSWTPPPASPRGSDTMKRADAWVVEDEDAK